MPLCDLLASRGVSVYYEFHGPLRKEFQGAKEETVFLIPGSAADLRKTTDQQYIRQSESYFRLLIFDHRNSGRSTIKDEALTMEDYADDAAALLEAVVPQDLPIRIMAWSFGGMVAQHLALRHPHLLKKLVLCCCGAGGKGGSSFPVHEWYGPGMTPDERVVQKVMLANLSRDEAWQKSNPMEWKLVFDLVRRDENVGLDDDLRVEGIHRQLQARSQHDTWDQISNLQMPVLCCGSPLDGICPPEITKAMAERIGSNCESRLDFAWGHAFIAADTKAMPFINEWFRKPLPTGWTPPLKSSIVQRPERGEDELRSFLRSNQLERTFKILQENGVNDLRSLQALTAVQLERLGFKLGAISKLRQALSQWKRPPPGVVSMPTTEFSVHKPDTHEVIGRVAGRESIARAPHKGWFDFEALERSLAD